MSRKISHFRAVKDTEGRCGGSIVNVPPTSSRATCQNDAVTEIVEAQSCTLDTTSLRSLPCSGDTVGSESQRLELLQWCRYCSHGLRPLVGKKRNQLLNHLTAHLEHQE